MGRKPRLIYEFSSGGLNEKVSQAAPKEAMRFRRALHCLLDCILAAEPSLWLTFFRKVALDDAYMHI